jgi:hypothetical protein
MLRKTIMALTAVAALGTAALAPTSASAHGWKFKPHFGWGYAPSYSYIVPGPSCYVVKKVTPFGFKFVKVCNHYNYY